MADRRHFARTVSVSGRIDFDEQQIVIILDLADGTQMEIPVGRDGAESIREMLGEALSEPEVQTWRKPTVM